jgi:hypothetical protein
VGSSGIRSNTLSFHQRITSNIVWPPSGPCLRRSEARRRVLISDESCVDDEARRESRDETKSAAQERRIWEIAGRWCSAVLRWCCAPTDRPVLAAAQLYLKTPHTWNNFDLVAHSVQSSPLHSQPLISNRTFCLVFTR